ncbi:hypothetical protein CC86DRAFT_386924 [Ophiobolus disseminans]|uniref:Uncharacterized protein n=1 Tax=Ophiobolus disseminans TaxID=1469910 RepID=A0A6A6ZKY4_9PLEO|nr:hypothetical protein CC86DRAFT_386924 [Ophiobolus disseminans]
MPMRQGHFGPIEHLAELLEEVGEHSRAEEVLSADGEGDDDGGGRERSWKGGKGDDNGAEEELEWDDKSEDDMGGLFVTQANDEELASSKLEFPDPDATRERPHRSSRTMR